MTEKALHEFFSNLIVLDNGCWVLNKAKFRLSDGKGARAEVYKHFIDPHVSSLVGRVLSTCATPKCVAPEHLRFVPFKSLLGPDKTCGRGHVGKWFLDTYDGKFRCRACKYASARRRKLRLDRMSDLC